ncbi:hypothetical protein FACS189463_1920 [Bacteroidia bacterium]|nr:hypothetical protein FACS189463_1920 [Bacteroidia bacterium]
MYSTKRTTFTIGQTTIASATILFSLITFPVFAQTNILKSGIEQIIAGKKAEIGVAVYEIESKETINVNSESDNNGLGLLFKND